MKRVKYASKRRSLDFRLTSVAQKRLPIDNKWGGGGGGGVPVTAGNTSAFIGESTPSLIGCNTRTF